MRYFLLPSPPSRLPYSFYSSLISSRRIERKAESTIPIELFRARPRERPHDSSDAADDRWGRNASCCAPKTTRWKSENQLPLAVIEKEGVGSTRESSASRTVVDVGRAALPPRVESQPPSRFDLLDSCQSSSFPPSPQPSTSLCSLLTPPSPDLKLLHAATPFSSLSDLPLDSPPSPSFPHLTSLLLAFSPLRHVRRIPADLP